jgi:hypothetical protein
MGWDPVLLRRYDSSTSPLAAIVRWTAFGSCEVWQLQQKPAAYEAQPTVRFGWTYCSEQQRGDWAEVRVQLFRKLSSNQYNVLMLPL